MYRFTVDEIIAGTEAEVHGNIPHHTVITGLAYDSRKIIYSEKTMFMALVTPTGNGHGYINTAYEKGIRIFLVSEQPDNTKYPKALFLQVPDTLKALQLFASKHRKKFPGKILALTGSYGKTTVKEWLYFLLAPEIRVMASPGSYNSTLGIPLSILMLSDTDQWGIIETGISHPGEMEHAETWVKPNAGILTNIGEAHIENFGSRQEILAEKIKLFSGSQYFIYHADDAILKENLMIEKRGIGWSFDFPFKSYKVEISESGQNATTISIHTSDSQTYTFSIPFRDSPSIENACHCAVFCIKESLFTPAVSERFSQLRHVDMRLQMVAGINRCTLLNDSYTSDITSLRIALEALSLLPGIKQHSVILTDMRLRGKTAAEVYDECAKLINDSNCRKIILIGKEISTYRMLFSGDVSSFESTEDFLGLFPLSEFRQEAILIKGIPEYKPERILEALEQKRHETVLEVNLDALAHNVTFLRATAGENTKVMAMVKAFSYGTGSIEIANHLKYRNVDYLAVAYTDEGAELRRAGIDLPIMVMNPGQPAVHMLLSHKLEPEIFSFRSLHYLLEELKRRSDNDLLPIHLKVDTGMHRLGFSPQEALEAARIIKDSGYMQIASVFSHLTSAEDENDDDFTNEQISVFADTCEKIKNITGYSFIRHIANTAGTLRHSIAKFDMVRMGIGMYGVSPHTSKKQELQPALRLKTSITQIRQIKTGESVGYNRAGKVSKDSTVATIPVGYADGFRRSLGLGNGQVFINGKRYPTIGKICMDMAMIDVTGGNVNEGDEVILFGPEYPVEEMAKKCDTIPYEILTGISPRVKRVYIKE